MTLLCIGSSRQGRATHLFSDSLFALIITGCGPTQLVTTPIANIDNTALKFNPLTEAEEKVWAHLNYISDTIPGMSIDKAYNEILKSKKGTKVIVAVIDSGIDINHEDLDDVIWKNKHEVPNNNKDDDNKGYVDDVHGWDFLGEGYDEHTRSKRGWRCSIGRICRRVQREAPPRERV